MSWSSPRVALSALFLHFPNSGTGRYLDRLIEASTGQVDLALLGARAFPPTDPRWNGAVSRLATPFDRRPSLAKIWFEQVALPRASREADLLHVPYFAAPLRPPRPTVVTVHDLVPVLRPEYRSTAAQRLYTALVSLGLRWAEIIITDSQASARDLERVLKVRPERIRVIPLAVDPRFRPLDPAEATVAAEARRRLGISGPYVLYLGGLDRRKNVDRLVGAFARLKRERRVPHQLVIVGARSQNDQFFYDPAPDVARLCLADSTLRLDRVSDAEARLLHAGAEVFVFPSLYEGFGLPPLEALACGAPVVCSKASSLPEVVGDAAVLADASDEVALAEAIGRVLDDPKLRQELAERGPRQAAEFTWEKTAAATIEVYRQAASASMKVFP